MTKVTRREAVALYLGAVACLGGCETQSGFKKPTLPENCYWVEFPYAWVCLPLSRPPEKEAQPPVHQGLLPELDWLDYRYQWCPIIRGADSEVHL